MRIEGLDASCSPSFDPLTDRPFTHPQRYRDILLLPTRLFQLPRSFPSFFSPIGFLWCSHTSYLTTLYFPLPRSVNLSVIAGYSHTKRTETAREISDLRIPQVCETVLFADSSGRPIENAMLMHHFVTLLSLPVLAPCALCAHWPA